MIKVTGSPDEYRQDVPPLEGGRQGPEIEMYVYTDNLRPSGTPGPAPNGAHFILGEFPVWYTVNRDFQFGTPVCSFHQKLPVWYSFKGKVASLVQFQACQLPVCKVYII